MNIEQFKSNFLWNFAEVNIVNCECYSHNCIVRNLCIYDFVKGEKIWFKVCNNVVKLYFENIEERHGTYLDFVDFIIKEYYYKKYDIELKDNFTNYRNKTIQNHIVNFVISSKPLICYGVTLEKAFEIIFNQDSPYTNFDLINEIKRTLIDYFKRNEYKKNVTLKQTIFKQLNKINFYNENSKVELLEILQNLFTLIIKNT